MQNTFRHGKLLLGASPTLQKHTLFLLGSTRKPHQQHQTGTKGFTLVELIVVVVIVGILAAVALPQFLGVKDSAKMTTQIGEASGLAKECSSAIIAGTNYPSAYTSPTGTGLAIVGPCDGTIDVQFTTNAATDKTIGAKCGNVILAASENCQMTIDKVSGSISYASI